MKYDDKKSHNINFFMREPRIKNLQIISSFVGWEQGVIVKEYDRKSLYPMLVKCYEHLHPLIMSNGSWHINVSIFWCTRVIWGGALLSLV